MGFRLFTDRLFSGSASAFLLVALEWAANYRDHNSWIIWLPIAGLIIGLYHYYGSSVVKGNNYCWKNMKVQKYNPFKMAPWSFWNHNHASFGGSAGREGTAVKWWSSS
jgi:H+/Cl- antiporter ClcA